MSFLSSLAGFIVIVVGSEAAGTEEARMRRGLLPPLDARLSLTAANIKAHSQAVFDPKDVTDHLVREENPVRSHTT